MSGNGESEMSWDEEFDFISIGSGAAGLMGAATAAEQGASAVVLEATDSVGGTTAFSGALLWVPCNRWQRAAGQSDDRARVKRYIERCLGAQRANDPRWNVFLDEINPTLAWLEANTEMRFDVTGYPDSYGEWPEGSSSRHVASHAVSLRPLGEWRHKLRKPLVAGQEALTLHDVERANAWLSPRSPRSLRYFVPRVLWRKLTGKVGLGVGLTVSLLGYLLRRSVPIHLNHRVTGLVLEAGAVSGVIVSSPAGERRIRARRGVLLACGGFDYDDALKSELLPGPLNQPQSPPVGRGDNVRLARQVGARLASLDEAWYLPGLVPAGSKGYEGHDVAVPMLTERMAPHTIWVNGAGRRFVNESGQNAANALYQRDSRNTLANLPAYVIFDQQFRERYHVFLTVAPKQPDPPGLIRADSLETLARELRIDAQGLRSTVERFNTMARKGRDDDFGRGKGAYERYFGDAQAAHPNLGTIEKPPFYGFELATSGVGTKGGALTDAHGRVLREEGGVLAGLYAAGNASAAFNGPITVAAGCTIGPAMVMARQAARYAMGTREAG